MKQLFTLFAIAILFTACTKEVAQPEVNAEEVVTSLSQGLYFANNDGADQALYLYLGDEYATGDTLGLARFALAVMDSEHFVITAEGNEIVFTAGEGAMQGETFSWTEPQITYWGFLAGGETWYKQD